jgi:hypothetical protein
VQLWLVFLPLFIASLYSHDKSQPNWLCSDVKIGFTLYLHEATATAMVLSLDWHCAAMHMFGFYGFW